MAAILHVDGDYTGMLVQFSSQVHTASKKVPLCPTDSTQTSGRLAAVSRDT